MDNQLQGSEVKMASISTDSSTDCSHLSFILLCVSLDDQFSWDSWRSGVLRATQGGLMSACALSFTRDEYWIVTADNVADMYKRPQASIKEINPLGEWFQYAAHTLNLVGNRDCSFMNFSTLYKLFGRLFWKSMSWNQMDPTSHTVRNLWQYLMNL